ncbi:MAG: hypothetical protein JSS86_17550 [Cyanobacteria bacterium SZAS LIN-2]|nr:hypothetical protein [Cyanobacteria bacterium SZAS LIN-2]
MEIFNAVAINETNHRAGQNPLIHQIASFSMGDSDDGRRPPIKQLAPENANPAINGPSASGPRRDNPPGKMETSMPPEDNPPNRKVGDGHDSFPSTCTKDLSHVALALDLQFTNDQMEWPKKDFKLEFSTGYFNNSIESQATSRDGTIKKNTSVTWEDNKDNVIVRATDSTGTMKLVATAPKADDGQLIFSSVMTKSDGTVKKGWEKASFDRDCTLRMIGDQWLMKQPDPQIINRTEIAIRNGNIAMIAPGSIGEGKYSANMLPFINGTKSGSMDVARVPIKKTVAQ